VECPRTRGSELRWRTVRTLVRRGTSWDGRQRTSVAASGPRDRPGSHRGRGEPGPARWMPLPQLVPPQRVTRFSKGRLVTAIKLLPVIPAGHFGHRSRQAGICSPPSPIQISSASPASRLPGRSITAASAPGGRHPHLCRRRSAGRVRGLTARGPAGPGLASASTWSSYAPAASAPRIRCGFATPRRRSGRCRPRSLRPIPGWRSLADPAPRGHKPPCR
jgi:hypothetical protein